MFSKSFGQTRKVIEKIDRRNLTEIKSIGQSFELGKSFEFKKLKTPLDAANKIAVENVEKTLPSVVSPQLLREKRMKFGDLNDVWSFKNDSNNIILENTDSVGEKSLSLGEGKGIPPMGMEIGPLGNLETSDNELLVKKGVGPLLLDWERMILIWIWILSNLL